MARHTKQANSKPASAKQANSMLAITSVAAPLGPGTSGRARFVTSLGSISAVTINAAAAGIKNVDTIINGHSPMTMKWQDLVEWGEFNRYFLNYTQQSLKAGKSAEEAMKEFKVPDGKFPGYNVTPGGGRGGPAGNVGIIYEELKGTK